MGQTASVMSPFDDIFVQDRVGGAHEAFDHSDDERRGSSSRQEYDEDLAKAVQASLDLRDPPSSSSRTRIGITTMLMKNLRRLLEIALRHNVKKKALVNCSLPIRPIREEQPTIMQVCAGCNREIGPGRFLSCMGSTWHPECFCCKACSMPITGSQFALSGHDHYHRECYKDLFHPKCEVCFKFIPPNSAGLIEYRAHPFWGQKYCPVHENDGTPRCCSCERVEARNLPYVNLGDGRKICLECLDSAVMDTHECQPLYHEILDFYEGMNMKIKQSVPMLLVERQALNEAREHEKDGYHHMPETRGLCLSEEQTVSSVYRKPKSSKHNTVIVRTESKRLTRHCEVTAILVLYGLPRLLTGSILAHELMHAWLRLNGFPHHLPSSVEEGICQVMAHMWLETQIGNSSNGKSKPVGIKNNRFQEFFLHQIAMDTSPAYGDGFRLGHQSVVQYGLSRTLDHIRLTGSFPV